MPPQLVALTDGPDLLLDKPILLLGRHQDCDIQLNSRKISRRHCCIALVNNQLVIRDLSSTNGIRINGTRVAEASLKEGDEVTIGNYHYRLRLAEQGAVAGQAVDIAARQRPTGAPDPDLSCDMPVPLPEPSQPRSPVFAAPAPRQVQKSAGPEPSAASPILPEQIGLAPRSGSRPPADPNGPMPSS